MSEAKLLAWFDQSARPFLKRHAPERLAGDRRPSWWAEAGHWCSDLSPSSNAHDAASGLCVSEPIDECEPK